jgi:hypothetical protein
MSAGQVGPLDIRFTVAFYEPQHSLHEKKTTLLSLSEDALPRKPVDYFRLFFSYTGSHVPRTGKLQACSGSV